MKLLRRWAEPVEEDWYIDLTERLAPYMKDVEAELAPAPPATFMRERPLRARPTQPSR